MEGILKPNKVGFKSETTLCPKHSIVDNCCLCAGGYGCTTHSKEGYCENKKYTGTNNRRDVCNHCMLNRCKINKINKISKQIENCDMEINMEGILEPNKVGRKEPTLCPKHNEVDDCCLCAGGYGCTTHSKEGYCENKKYTGKNNGRDVCNHCMAKRRTRSKINEISEQIETCAMAILDVKEPPSKKAKTDGKKKVKSRRSKSRRSKSRRSKSRRSKSRRSKSRRSKSRRSKSRRKSKK